MSISKAELKLRKFDKMIRRLMVKKARTNKYILDKKKRNVLKSVEKLYVGMRLFIGAFRAPTYFIIRFIVIEI